MILEGFQVVKSAWNKGFFGFSGDFGGFLKIWGILGPVEKGV